MDIKDIAEYPEDFKAIKTMLWWYGLDGVLEMVHDAVGEVAAKWKDSAHAPDETIQTASLDAMARLLTLMQDVRKVRETHEANEK